MTKMISLIIVILFFFIMVLCAIQPICFPNATELEYNHRLSIVDTEINTDRFHLMLDNETPLTLRYFKDNPDFYINIVCSHGGYSVQCDDHTSTTSIFNVGNTANTEYRLCYENISAWVWVYEQEESILDSPLYISFPSYDDTLTGINSTFRVYSAWNYQKPLLEKLGMVITQVINFSRTAIRFIIDNPLILLSVAVSFVSVAIIVAKRFLVR